LNRNFHPNRPVPITNTYNDTELLIQLAGNSEEAFSLLYQRYWAKIYSVSDHYLKDKSMVADIVQEVFLIVWKKRAGLHSVLHLESYLHIIARNLIISSLRKKIPLYYELRENDCMNEENSLRPGQQLEYKETAELVRVAVTHLSPRQKQVYQLSRDKEFSLKDTAVKLNISYDAARQYKSEALKTIRGFLKRNALRMFFTCLAGLFF
jgi:RNA polymerase sigma-70 factor (ECF subfamily)